MVTQDQEAHATPGRVGLRMMVPVVPHILVRVAHAIQVLVALSTQALVVLHTMAREAPDILAQVGRHTMVPAARLTMAREGLAIQAPVDRVIPARGAPAKIALVFVGRDLYTHNNRVNPDCPKLRRFALHLWAAGHARRYVFS